MLRGIRIGELDTSITIQSVSTTNHTDTNQPINTYTDLITVWAKRLSGGSKEDFEANQQVAVTRYRFMIRRLTTVTEKMRIVEGDNTYMISGIEDFGRQGYMILTAVKRDR